MTRRTDEALWSRRALSLRCPYATVWHRSCRCASQLTDSVVTWRQTLYNSTKEEANGVLVEEPSLPVSPVAALPGGQVSAPWTTPPVNNGVVRSGLRMMVSRM